MDHWDQTCSQGHYAQNAQLEQGTAVETKVLEEGPAYKRSATVTKGCGDGLDAQGPLLRFRLVRFPAVAEARLHLCRICHVAHGNTNDACKQIVR